MKKCKHDYEGTYFRSGSKIIVFDQCFMCGEYGMRGNSISSFQPFKDQIASTVRVMNEIVADADDVNDQEVAVLRRQCHWLESLLSKLS